jgi:hypothetical protein
MRNYHRLRQVTIPTSDVFDARASFVVLVPGSPKGNYVTTDLRRRELGAGSRDKQGARPRFEPDTGNLHVRR